MCCQAYSTKYALCYKVLTVLLITLDSVSRSAHPCCSSHIQGLPVLHILVVDLIVWSSWTLHYSALRTADPPCLILRLIRRPFLSYQAGGPPCSSHHRQQSLTCCVPSYAEHHTTLLNKLMQCHVFPSMAEELDQEISKKSHSYHFYSYF